MASDYHSGEIIEYLYLWAREAERGEISGRKARTACVQVMMRGEGSVSAVLFAITSQPPAGGQTCIPVPRLEAKRGGLYEPAWVIVDEWNEDPNLLVSLYVFAPRPRGKFSAAFMREVTLLAAKTLRAGRMGRTLRRP